MPINLEQCRENVRKQFALDYDRREVLRQHVREKAIAAILRVIPLYPQITHLYLFGSVTQPGQFSDRSDIDIAVAGTNAADYFTLWRDLEIACPDWCIDLREINKPCHFTEVVKNIGELIYDSSNEQNCYFKS